MTCEDFRAVIESDGDLRGETNDESEQLLDTHSESCNDCGRWLSEDEEEKRKPFVVRDSLLRRLPEWAGGMMRTPRTC
jgi:hypothetical protein